MQTGLNQICTVEVGSGLELSGRICYLLANRVSLFKLEVDQVGFYDESKVIQTDLSYRR